jgi:integral membrane protein
MWATSVGRLRAIGLIEGVSFLILLGIAMPMKYLADQPEAVKIVGWIHGLLFIIFCTALAVVHRKLQWTLSQSAVVFVAALLPFGPFFIDGRLKRLSDNTST